MIFVTTKLIGDREFEGDLIEADSWEEAEVIAKWMGVEVEGELVDEIPAAEKDERNIRAVFKRVLKEGAH